MPSDLPTSALDYPLPERLIATRPAEPRDAARLLVVRRSGGGLEHRSVRDLPEYLRAGDLLVMNDTAVAPARIIGRRADSGGRVEGLFLDAAGDGTWRLLLKSNGRLRPGQAIDLLPPEGATGGVRLRLVDRAAREDDDDGGEGGAWVARIEPDGEKDRAVAAAGDDALLDAVGHTPLPPYILRARRRDAIEVAEERDRSWYQTIYADARRRGSVAAPTAGLHFTPDLLAALDARGVDRARVTLHVGTGTFRPVTAETLAGHAMHRERFEVDAPALDLLRARDAAGSSDAPGAPAPPGAAGRLIAVGTTTVRTLESLPRPLPEGDVVTGATDLLIAPPHEFRRVDGLLTNFHLPRSTLLALVAALVGLDRLLAIYAEAVRREYRFYSYGDAMLILP